LTTQVPAYKYLRKQELTQISYYLFSNDSTTNPVIPSYI